jgi:hypothetical protein
MIDRIQTVHPKIYDLSKAVYCKAPYMYAIDK